MAQHVCDAIKFARKKDISSHDILQQFPTPRSCDVDSDDWIDLNSMDDLERKMNEITKFSNSNPTGTTTNDDAKLQEMDKLVQGVEKFIGGSSDLLKGVSFERMQQSDEENSDKIVINSRVFLNILQKVLKYDTETLRFDDVLISSEDRTQKNESVELLKFFSEEDLDWDNDDASSIDNDEHMKAIMVSV